MDFACDEISDRSESTSSPSVRDDIKVFKRLWNQRIINVSRDFKFSKDKDHSKFQISLRVLKGVKNGAGRKLRVRGELECKNMVRTHLPHIAPIFYLTTQSIGGTKDGSILGRNFEIERRGIMGLFDLRRPAGFQC